MDVVRSPNLVTSAERYQLVRYVTVGAATLLIYDWLILLTDEIELIWSGKLTFTKSLYLLSRYLPFFDTTLNILYYTHSTISPSTCRWNYSASTWSTGIGMGIAELILCVRTYAIYERSRKIFWSLGILWVLWVLGNAPVVWIFTHSLAYEARPDPAMPGCYMSRGSPIVFGSFASLLLFEILIVVLTVKKGLVHLRSTRLGRNRMLEVLYRDGVIFFAVMTVSSLANAIVMALAPVEYLDLLDTLLRITHALICCRVLLNLRRTGASESRAEQSTTRRPSSGAYRGRDWGVGQMTTLAFVPTQISMDDHDDMHHDARMLGGSAPWDPAIELQNRRSGVGGLT